MNAFVLHPIRRDSDGFATDEALEEIYKNLPVITFKRVGEGMYPQLEYIDEDNWCDSIHDIETKPTIAYWKPTVALAPDLYI